MKIFLKKGLFVTFLGCLLFFLAFTLFSHKKVQLVDEALIAFLQRDFATTETILCKAERNKPSYPLFFYHGFLAQAKGDFLNSNLLFQKALFTCEEEEDQQAIFLGKALNAYFEENANEIPSLLERAKSTKLPNSQLLFIEALFHYETKDFARAVPLFSSYLAVKQDIQANWLQGVIDLHFSPSWIKIHLAHAFCEVGEFTQARDILEKAIDLPYLSTEESQAATLFLGLNYFKEGCRADFAEKKSFFNVALFYFDRCEDSCEEKEFATRSILAELESLLQKEDEFFFAFIHLLEKWNAAPSLEKVAELVINKITSDSHLAALSFCNTLNEEFSEGSFHTIVIEQLFANLEKSLGKIKNPFEMWQKLEALSPNLSPSYTQKIAALTSEEIINMAQEEKEPLHKTLFYLKFWKTVETDESNKNAFAHALLNCGMLFWRKGNDEQKGSHLMQIALHVADESTKGELSNDVEAFFIALYHQAQFSNMVSRLSMIYDAFQEFNIGFRGLLTKDELANHLADASYLFHAHNYLLAKANAEWVLKIEPKNEEALRLLGLTSFHLGQYPLALEALNKVATVDDDEVEEAILLSQAFFSKDSSEPLVQVDLLGSLQEME